MERDRRGRGGGETGTARRSGAAPGKRTLTERLGRRSTTPAQPAGEAAAGDIAGAAIEHKGSGAAVDPGIASAVAGQVGHDVSAARVHGDEDAAAAADALGARAFAYGDDVFLGTGESPHDTALMAHELTHVAQQSGQAARAQRQVEVGAQDHPAEQHADAVAARVADGAPAATLVVADGATPAAGQLTRAEFLALLHAEVIAAASDALGPMWSVAGCPYIERWFAQHQDTDATQLEALARRYAGTGVPLTARDYVAPICARLRGGIIRWRDGEDVGAELAAAGLGAAADAAGTGPGAPAPEGDGDASVRRVVAELGTGDALESSVRARMGDALGEDLGDVRVHTGTPAARLAAREGAAAVAVGSHVAFADGRYQPGEPAGDALIAHELAHVVQQRGATSVDAGGGDTALESDADQVAVGAVARLYGGMKAAVGRSSVAMKSGLGLRRCNSSQTSAPRDAGAIAGAPAAQLTPVERALDGQDPFTVALATLSIGDYAALAPADRQRWIERWSPRGHIDELLALIPRADISVGGTHEATIRDILQRVQRAGALESAQASGLGDQAAMAQAQATHMHTANQAAAAAAAAPGTTPSAADVAAQQSGQVAATSIAPQTATLTPQREAAVTAQAHTAVATFITWVHGAHPTLPITAANFSIEVRGVFERGDGIVAYAVAGTPPKVGVGEPFVQMVTANPAYALPTVVHELWGHNEYGEYGAPGAEYGLELYDQAAALMPGYTQPGGDARTSELDAYGYQETEMYSLMREVEYYTPNAPNHGHLADMNYDPIPAIRDRVENIVNQFEPRVAKAHCRGLYQRYSIEPRIVPAALEAFRDGVRTHVRPPRFTPADVAAILR